MSDILFTKTHVGPYELEHRVALAPLTRMRSEPGDTPGDLMVEYYSQRATAGGLIVAEATSVSTTGIAYANAPGVYADAQVDGWRRVVDAVHAKGGRIFLQLWHAGRQAHPDNTKGVHPVAPSELASEEKAVTRDAQGQFVESDLLVPRALELHEIPLIIEEFRLGALRAKAAGFDGVELHAANGYLPDQFLQDGTNKRTDEYGGSISNRARFLIEAVEALVSVWGGNRVAVRISPSGQFGTMFDSDPSATFGYVAEQLNRFNLAYLHVIEPRIKGVVEIEDNAPATASKNLRTIFHGPIVAAGGFDRESAIAILEEGDADIVAFGRHYISNPDLPERLRHNFPLTPYDRSTFYGGDHKGYSDYPVYAHLDS
ncbi:alkene reductase [Pseudomonas sp. RC10]|uniref:alkene reductase n=1 Tax=Pseudomonas bambusae TaxID=3139142 RepID=UPI003138E767